MAQEYIGEGAAMKEAETRREMANALKGEGTAMKTEGYGGGEQHQQQTSPYTGFESKGGEMAHAHKGEGAAIKTEGYAGGQHHQQQASPYTGNESKGEYLKEGALKEAQAGREIAHAHKGDGAAMKTEGYGGGQQHQQQASPYTGHEHKGEGAAMKTEGYGGGQQHQQQESPYTGYENMGEYLKGGYGAEGYKPTGEPTEEQPNYYSTTRGVPPAPAHEEEAKPGMMEKIMDKIPCIGGGGDGDGGGRPEGGHQGHHHGATTPPPKKGVAERK